MQAILGYERALSLEMLKVLHACKARIYGIADPARIASRVPTLCFNIEGRSPAAVTEAMARAGIGIRDARHQGGGHHERQDKLIHQHGVVAWGPCVE